jgi:ParD-like antitoxin of type II bacterial toxin-antitoxin system
MRIMSQPVKLSDALVLDARIAGTSMERSIAGQVEFWARLGKAVEGLLRGQQMMTLGREVSIETIRERLEGADTPEGRQRVKDYLASEPYPHYFAHPAEKDLIIREDENGGRVAGRFVNREFVAVKRKRKMTTA